VLIGVKQHMPLPSKDLFSMYVNDEDESENTCKDAGVEVNGTRLFNHVYDMIHENQLRIFGAQWGTNINTVVQEYSKLLHMEVDETLRTVNFKAHLPLFAVNKQLTKQESIDVLIYAFAQCGCVFPNYEEFQGMLIEKILDANEKGK
jgi:hypothetical protein